jgi:hypothetical protein
MKWPMSKFEVWEMLAETDKPKQSVLFKQVGPTMASMGLPAHSYERVRHDPYAGGVRRRIFRTPESGLMLATFQVGCTDLELNIGVSRIEAGIGGRLADHSGIISFFATDSIVLGEVFHIYSIFGGEDDLPIALGIELWERFSALYLKRLERHVKWDLRIPRGCYVCGWDGYRLRGLRAPKCTSENKRHRAPKTLLNKAWRFEFTETPAYTDLLSARP